MAKIEPIKGNGWEQLGLNLVANTSPQREYTEIKKDYRERYLEINHINDESRTRFLAYLDFKSWLFHNFKQFDDTKEIEHDKWQLKNKDRILDVKLTWRVNNDNLREQYVSVGFQKMSGDYHGWGSPCYTLKEVREDINRGLKDLYDKRN